MPSLPEGEPGTPTRSPDQSTPPPPSTAFSRGIRWLNWAVTHPVVLLKPARYLFILSHMRSRSTLLSHVFGSHPEISGYLEAQLHYRGTMDFLRLRRFVSLSTGQKSLNRYVVDKVLFNDSFEPEIIDRVGISPIFLLRKPEESIKSTCSMMRPRTPQLHMDKSVDYYLKRVEWLERCARTIRTKGIFIESASLVSQTQEVFRLVQDKLALSAPLSESYQTFTATGKTVRGDPSKMISEGQIVRDGRKSYTAELVVPPDALARAEELYERCLATMRDRCWHI
ncbi:MAG: hypothetical protein J0M24_07820 [Verrucomicrobia bacterium]|nr:hypothetical protein [Verrucomicrobiota bacterium]